MSFRQRSFLLVTLVAVALSSLLKWPTLELSHKEPDEVIYWTLAHSLLERGEYGLQDTKLVEILPASMYDRPLFHHPPLFVGMLVPFAAADAWSGAITVSWLGHALAILAVALVATRLCRERGLDGSSYAFWMPLLAVALDPIFLFTSRKLWIDSLLGGLTVLAVACAVVARGHPRQRAWLVGSGLALGLAGLAKLTAALALPAILAATLLPRRDVQDAQATDSASRAQALALVLVPTALLMLPWFIVFWAEYGTLLPWWSRPSDEMIARDALIRAAVSQGPSYYIARLVCVQPLFLLVVALALGRRLRPQASVRVALVLAGSFLIGLTLIAQAGGSPQFLRYLIPVFPVAAWLLAGALATGTTEAPGRRPAWTLFAATLCIAYAAAVSVPYLVTSRGNELFSWIEDWAGWYR